MNNYEEIYMYLKVLVASCGGDEGGGNGGCVLIFDYYYSYINFTICHRELQLHRRVRESLRLVLEGR